ncbi:HAD-IA family hydrolase [Streptomyces sp. NBC_00250]|uniref:HAD-IA family hydrolase n=1 Tax=Streptomyces sp. NBC_00250 TaxID=2903641 RepID=UPI002E2B70C3|nr:HAD-IA family hydrolase [Streptomyces sp. NBC_00250]
MSARTPDGGGPTEGPYFLFDIDGTLVDSSGLIVSVWKRVAAEFGADAQAILSVCHGRRDSEVVPLFFRPEDIPRVTVRIQELEAEGVGLLHPVPGAPELLRGLPSGRWAAVTSGPSLLMTGRLSAVGLPSPEVLVAADHVRRGKPDPESYLAAAVALGVDPGACVVVEDAPVGVAAGREAGMFVIGLTTTHTAAQLAGADVVVASLAEVPGVAAAWSGRAGRAEAVS